MLEHTSCSSNYWMDPSYSCNTKQSWTASQSHLHGCRFWYIMGHRIQEANLLTTLPHFSFFWKVIRHCWSQHQDEDGYLTFASKEYGTGREPAAPVGSSKQDSCGPRTVCLFEEPEGQKKSRGGGGGCLSLRVTSQLACTGSSCRAAAGQHLGRASGNPLHM